MINKYFLSMSLCVLLFVPAFGFSGFALDNNKINVINLSKPDLKSGKLLMQALQDRKSSRSFSSKELDDKLLSNLLWAGFGINRKDGKRTAPTACNTQNITIYVALKNGVYEYIPSKYLLRLTLSKDIRKELGYQDFLSKAPAVLILVADLEQPGKMQKKDRIFYSAANTGYISQNIYLFCASENLATVAVGWVKREALTKILKLNKEQEIVLVQPVGYPAKN